MDETRPADGATRGLPLRRELARWWRADARGDLAGAASSTLLGVPLCIGFGAFAFSPLGAAYVPYGAAAGLLTLVVMNLVVPLSGARSPVVFAPSSIVALMVGATLAQTLVAQLGDRLGALPPAAVLAGVALLGFLAGLFQLVFGLLRLGNCVKYVPFPVVAGFQNGVALLLFTAQLGPLLGFAEHVAIADLPERLAEAAPGALAIGTLVCAIHLASPRLTRTVPPVLIAALAGLCVWYAAHALFPLAALGPVLGSMPELFPPGLPLAGLGALLTMDLLLVVLPGLIAGAAALALAGSMDALLTAKAIEALGRRRFNGNALLMQMGSGTLCASSLGGMPGTVNVAINFANRRGGARTRAAPLLAALLVLGLLVVAAPLVAAVPRVVIAGLLAAIALLVFDRWTLRMLRCLVHALAERRVPSAGLLLDLATVAAVAATALVVGVIEAVALGVAVSVAAFVVRMSRSVVRRSYGGDLVRSRRARPVAQLEVLARHGHRILVLELEGPIFFGSAERLANRLDALRESEVDFLVLDCARVTQIDSTGCSLLLMAHDRLIASGRRVAICGLVEASGVRRMLAGHGVLAAVGRERTFADADRALEWAEDLVIADATGVLASPDRYPLERLPLFAGLDADALRIVRGLLEVRRFGAGEPVIRASAHDCDLFLIGSGSASVWQATDGPDQQPVRLATFGVGTVLGELALLDRDARSANVVADRELVCYTLAAEALDTLCERHPELAARFLANLARELAQRLRFASRSIALLAS